MANSGPAHASSGFAVDFAQNFPFPCDLGIAGLLGLGLFSWEACLSHVQGTYRSTHQRGSSRGFCYFFSLSKWFVNMCTQIKAFLSFQESSMHPGEAELAGG